MYLTTQFDVDRFDDDDSWQPLGKVLLAAPLGSQRYNLHVPEQSDYDFYVVYQVLSLSCVAVFVLL